MDITFDAESVEVLGTFDGTCNVTVKGVFPENILKHFSFEDIIEYLGKNVILDHIGESEAREHFGIEEE